MSSTRTLRNRPGRANYGTTITATATATMTLDATTSTRRKRSAEEFEERNERVHGVNGVENIVKRRKAGSSGRQSNGSVEEEPGLLGFEREREDRGDTITVCVENSLPSPPAEVDDDDAGSSIEVDTGSRLKKNEHNKHEGNGKTRIRGLTGGGKDEGQQKDKERNIDEVVFGDICFKSWYSSWYPRDVTGASSSDTNGHGGGEGGKDTKEGKGIKGVQTEKLWVCSWCFAYSVSGIEMKAHRDLCERRKTGPPGKKIYEHDDRGMWSVWEVDGEDEATFCQCLSLFAKLFLDNKSVFFDVTSFNYFLLVHTSPSSTPSSPPDHQIVGFFSKEKMSWDNNNLACILIFPPWQKKGLGALLMGVSYEIAKREAIMGGPEKPISELGRKGYARFWSSEVARWLLDFEGKGKGGAVRASGKGMGKGWRKGMKGVGMKGLVVGAAGRAEDCGMCSVEEVSRGTWIAVEDCLGALRGMGVVAMVEGSKGGEEKIRVDKENIRRWVQEEGIRLERSVREEGFVEGYGYPVDEDKEEEEDSQEMEDEVEDSADDSG